MASDALRKCHDAIVNPSDGSTYPDRASTPDFPTLDSDPTRDLGNRLGHWDSWVIPYIVLPDLLRPLDYVVAPGRASATLQVGGARAFTLRRPTLDQFKKELPDAIADAQLREERESEILMQMQDTWPFFAMILPISPDKTPATWLLMSVAQQLALHVEMRFKHELACARPAEYSAQAQPMFRTPGHGTYPMGHMCEATVTATLLAQLTKPSTALPAWGSLQGQLLALADRIGENRIVAGVHFAVDRLAGQALGNALGDYFVSRCESGPGSIPVEEWSFDPATGNTTQIAGEATQVVLSGGRELQRLWQEARAEWGWLNAEVQDENTR